MAVLLLRCNCKFVDICKIKNSLIDRTFPLPAPRLKTINLSKNNFDSKYFLFTGALMGIKVDGGWWRGDNVGITTSEKDLEVLEKGLNGEGLAGHGCLLVREIICLMWQMSTPQSDSMQLKSLQGVKF
jgi:hypothetical protein